MLIVATSKLYNLAKANKYIENNSEEESYQ